MSIRWYPVIDNNQCYECGACVNKCTHGVYDKENGLSPKVINPEGCIDGCHGCGNLCPSGALQYSGEINIVE